MLHDWLKIISINKLKKIQEVFIIAKVKNAKILIPQSQKKLIVVQAKQEVNLNNQLCLKNL